MGRVDVMLGHASKGCMLVVCVWWAMAIALEHCFVGGEYSVWRESIAFTYATTRGLLCGIFAEMSGGGVRGRGSQGGPPLRATVGVCFEPACSRQAIRCSCSASSC